MLQSCHLQVVFYMRRLGCSPPAELALALAESMAEAEELEGARPGGGAPPASRHAVRALVRERLSEARLQELGRPECSVCRCLFRLLHLQHQLSAVHAQTHDTYGMSCTDCG